MLLVVRDVGPRVKDPFYPFNDGLGGSLVRRIVDTHFQDDVHYYMVAPNEKSFTKKVREAYAESFYEDLEELKPTKILAMGVGVDNLLRERTSHNANTTSARGELYEYTFADGSKALCITTIGVNNFEIKDKKTKIWKINTSNFRDFSFDLIKLDKNNSVPSLPQIHRHVVDSVVDLERELAYLASASALSLDIETSNHTKGSSPDPREDEIYAIGFGALFSEDVMNISYSMMIPVDILRAYKEDVVEILVRFFDNYEGRFVLHNAMFDIRFLALYLDYNFLSTDIADTMLMASMVDERPANSRMGGVSLKVLSRLYFNVPDFSFSWDEFYSKSDDDKDWEALYYYLGYDTHCTIALYHVLQKELQNEDELNKVLETILFPAAVRFAHIVNNGMPVDRDYLQRKINEYTVEIEDLLQQMAELVAEYGVDLSEINMNSVPDKKKFFKETFDVTLENTKMETLLDAAFFSDDDNFKKFVTIMGRYSEVYKLLGTYMKPLYAASELDGKVHGDFFLNGTATGRLSSANPNLQNMAGTDDYAARKAFIAPEGYWFVEVDYSQLEMKCMAIVSEDFTLMEAIRHGKDLHLESAAGIFKKDPSLISKDERSLAKIFNFGLQYRRTASGMVKGAEMRELRRQGKQTMTYDEANAAIDAYFEKYPGVKEWMDWVIDFAGKHQYVESVFGRVRRFPLILNENWWSVKNQAVNMPIQSMAGDFTLYSIVVLYDLLYQKFGDAVIIVNTVHDSILFLIRKDILDEALEVIQGVMENPPVDTKNVPITTDVDLGVNWGVVKPYEKINMA